MSHQRISWLLSLAAFVLFVLACTIGRYTTKQRTELTAKKAPGNPDTNIGLTAAAPALRGSSTAVKRCVLEKFYAARPDLQGQIPNLVENAIAIKLVSLAQADGRHLDAPTSALINCTQPSSFVAEAQ